jgi:hypothetical protein
MPDQHGHFANRDEITGLNVDPSPATGVDR